MTSEDPIATKVLKDLKGGPYACTSLIPVSGGSANFTYRGILTTPRAGASSVFIKHAENYVATNTTSSLDVSRSKYEQAMLLDLVSLPSTQFHNVLVTTPRLYQYSSSTGTAVMSDYPSSMELKKYITTHPLSPDEVFLLGNVLGQWLKNFHLWANAPEQFQLREIMKGNYSMAAVKFAVNYGRTLATIELFPKLLEDARELFTEMDAKFRQELESQEGELVHGDFWTGNVILHGGSIPVAATLKLCVVDWELSHIGSRAQDIGQCLAELYLLTHFRSITAGVAFIKNFLLGYGPVDDHIAFRIAVHFGVHLIVWPCRVSGWGTGEIMEKCIVLGKDYCRHAWKKDRKWFEGSALDALFFLATSS